MQGRQRLRSTAISVLKVTLLCVFKLSLHAQTDSTYIQSHHLKIVPRISYTYKIQDIYFMSKSSDSTHTTAGFSTGSQFLVGGAVSYKWINAGYSFSLSPNSTKRNMDFRISTAYRPFQLQFNFSYLQNLNYSLVNSSNYGEIRDTVISQREQDISIITSKLKVDYVFNYRKYSYSAGFSPVNRQLKSEGSLIASAALSNDDIALDNLSPLTKPKFDSINGFTHALINSFDLGMGYGFNWVINKHWTLSFIEIPKIGFELIKTRRFVPENYFFTVGFVNHFKGGVQYTNNNFFTGLSAYNLVNVSKIRHGTYNNVYNSVAVYLGWVIERKKGKGRFL